MHQHSRTASSPPGPPQAQNVISPFEINSSNTFSPPRGPRSRRPKLFGVGHEGCEAGGADSRRPVCRAPPSSPPPLRQAVGTRCLARLQGRQEPHHKLRGRSASASGCGTARARAWAQMRQCNEAVTREDGEFVHFCRGQGEGGLRKMSPCRPGPRYRGARLCAA